MGLQSILRRRKETAPQPHSANDDMVQDDILMTIKAEHRYALRLIPAFMDQADRLENADNVDYELINDLLDFFSGPMDREHHKKEDMVYNWMRENVPSQSQGLADVEADHKAFAVKLASLRKDIDAVLLDQDIPRSQLATKLRDFANRQLNHIRMEEAAFIPLADMLLPESVRREFSAQLIH